MFAIKTDNQVYGRLFIQQPCFLVPTTKSLTQILFLKPPKLAENYT